MTLLDTNIVIYLANGRLGPQVLAGHQLAFASLTRIEALGYGRITVAEQAFLNQFFAECTQLDLDEPVISSSIAIRQQTGTRLADAIIAATALENDCELWTANVKDFADIAGLLITNPLAK